MATNQDTLIGFDFDRANDSATNNVKCSIKPTRRELLKLALPVGEEWCDLIEVCEVKVVYCQLLVRLVVVPSDGTF